MDFFAFLWAIVLSVGAFAGGAAYGVLGMTPARYRDARILFCISALSVAAMAVLFGLTVPVSPSVRMIGTGLIGALAAIIAVESTKWVNGLEQGPKKQASLAEFITWDRLSPARLTALQQQLPKRDDIAVFVGCANPFCETIAIQIVELFRQAGWKSAIVQPNSNLPPDRTTHSGLHVRPNTTTTREIKKAFESVAGIPVELPPREQDESDAKLPKVLAISILSKPLPDNIPATVQQELVAMAKTLRDLSEQIVTFSADRARERVRAPAISDPSEKWESDRDFRNETESLLVQRFGTRLTFHYAQLAGMGIALPSWVRTDDAIITARFLSVMAGFLEQGQLKEARASGINTRFWFNQHGPYHQ